MRLFTGIDLPQPIKERLDVLVSHLRAHAHIKWSPVYNLHITTKFIGEWPQARLAELDAALKAVKPAGPIHLDVRGLGWFPNVNHPRTFWAGVKAPPALADLYRDTDAALAELGVPHETKAYSPHLTLARIKEPVPLDSLRHAIASLDSVEFGSYTPGRFHLYLSTPGSAGSVYTKLHDYPLPTA